MKQHHLKLTSAIVLQGHVIRAGTIVEVDERLAMNLLHRGKAVVATATDAPEDSGDHAVDLSRMNKAQLQDMAEKMGLDTKGMAKAEIQAAIEAAQAGGGDDDETEGDE